MTPMVLAGGTVVTAEATFRGDIAVAGGRIAAVGADLPREEEELTREITKRGWSTTTFVGNDTFALLRAGTNSGVGVAVVCGAGINAVGVAHDGRTHRFPALGAISGDWGGGGQLGNDALWHAVRAEDGRGEPTELLPALPKNFPAPVLVVQHMPPIFTKFLSDRLASKCAMKVKEAEAGDLIYIPADTPHLPFNPGPDACTAVIARTDPNEQESVVLLPELEHLVP